MNPSMNAIVIVAKRIEKLTTSPSISVTTMTRTPRGRYTARYGSVCRKIRMVLSEMMIL